MHRHMKRDVRRRGFAVFIAMATSASGGAVDGVDAGGATAAIDPLFDCYSANSAWGLNIVGKVVDRGGRVWTYRQRGKALPEATVEGGRSSFDALALRTKYVGATGDVQIDAAIVAQKIALIEKADKGVVTASDTGVRDAGTSTCHAYVAEAGGSRYHDVELGSDGGAADRRFVNDASEAKDLLDWLRSIGVAR